VLRLELRLLDLPGADREGDLPALENDVLLEEGLEKSVPIAGGEFVWIGDVGSLKWPPKSREGMSVRAHHKGRLSIQPRRKKFTENIFTDLPLLHQFLRCIGRMESSVQ
jgi:hypothetical protein